MFTLLIVRIPEPKRTTETEQKNIFGEVKLGWDYIYHRKGLYYWMLYIAVLNYSWSAFGVLLMPMLLELADAQQVGFVNSVIGVGALVGTFIMSIWGGTKRRIYAVLGGGLGLGVFYLGIGATRSLTIIAISGFMLLVCMMILNANSRAMWQTKIPPDIQGRVFSIRRVIGTFSYPISALLIGPLVDYVFQPAMEPDGWLAGSFGKLIGVGSGRGTALAFIIFGLVMVIASLAGAVNHTLMNTELDIPDAEVVVQGQ